MAQLVTSLDNKALPAAPATAPALASSYNSYDAWLTYTIVEDLKSLTSNSWVLTELKGFKDIVSERPFTEVDMITAGFLMRKKEGYAGVGIAFDGTVIDTSDPANLIGLPHKAIICSTDFVLGLSETRMVLEEGSSRQISPPPTNAKIPKIFISSPGDTADLGRLFVTIRYRQGGPRHTVSKGFA